MIMSQITSFQETTNLSLVNFNFIALRRKEFAGSGVILKNIDCESTDRWYNYVFPKRMTKKPLKANEISLTKFDGSLLNLQENEKKKIKLFTIILENEVVLSNFLSKIHVSTFYLLFKFAQANFPRVPGAPGHLDSLR